MLFGHCDHVSKEEFYLDVYTFLDDVEKSTDISIFSFEPTFQYEDYIWLLLMLAAGNEDRIPYEESLENHVVLSLLHDRGTLVKQLGKGKTPLGFLESETFIYVIEGVRIDDTPRN